MVCGGWLLVELVGAVTGVITIGLIESVRIMDRVKSDGELEVGAIVILSKWDVLGVAVEIASNVDTGASNSVLESEVANVSKLLVVGGTRVSSERVEDVVDIY